MRKSASVGWGNSILGKPTIGGSCNSSISYKNDIVRIVLVYQAIITISPVDMPVSVAGSIADIGAIILGSGCNNIVIWFIPVSMIGCKYVKVGR